jgi:hypothetical protein
MRVGLLPENPQLATITGNNVSTAHAHLMGTLWQATDIATCRIRFYSCSNNSPTAYAHGGVIFFIVNCRFHRKKRL